MRRFVVIVLMCLLPLQWSWAAAARACQHDGKGQHFGHHDHVHAKSEASGAGGGSSEAELGGGSHPDCKSCTGVGLGFADTTPPVADWAGGPPAPFVGLFVPEPPFAQLLRPPLPLVA